MAILQITSVKRPFTTSWLAHEALMAIERADAMGLLPESQRIDTLDLPVLRKVISHVHRAGIGKGIVLGDDLIDEASTLERLVTQLNVALEESPAPAYEWNRLANVLGIELLAQLLGISSSSVRRYKVATRTTPDEVAARLHVLALIVGDLSGAYNDLGIRQWFSRRRTQLGGRAPADVLAGNWDPMASGPQQVRGLARSLTASPAT